MAGGGGGGATAPLALPLNPPLGWMVLPEIFADATILDRIEW